MRLLRIIAKTLQIRRTVMITFDMFKQFVSKAILTGSFSYVKDGKEIFCIESLCGNYAIELRTWDE